VQMLIAPHQCISSMECIPGYVPSVYGLGREGESSGRMERVSAAFGCVGGMLLAERGADVWGKNDFSQIARDVARSERKVDVEEWLNLVSRG